MLNRNRDYIKACIVIFIACFCVPFCAGCDSTPPKSVPEPAPDAYKYVRKKPADQKCSDMFWSCYFFGGKDKSGCYTAEEICKQRLEKNKSTANAHGEEQ